MRSYVLVAFGLLSPVSVYAAELVAPVREGPVGLAAPSDPNVVPNVVPAPPLPLEGAVIRPTSAAGALTQAALTQAYDAPGLFRAAAEAVRAGDEAQGITLYGQFLTAYPQNASVPLAHFNRGLLYEGQRQFALANADYRAIIQAGRTVDRTWIDAHFRLAVCLGKLAQWWEAVAVFDAILQEHDLEDFDHLEAEVGEGIAMQEGGDPTSAEAALSRALRFLDGLNKDQHFVDDGLGAEAAFRLGDIARGRFEAVTLAFPIDTLRRALGAKCEVLLVAQSRYLRAIRYGDAHTVAAAGFHIGSLYASLYDAIVSLAPPAELTPEERDVYQEEVRQRVGVLVKKAIMVYEKSLATGRTVGTADTWVTQLEQALARLRTIYLSDSQASAGVRDKRGLTPRAETVH